MTFFYFVLVEGGRGIFEAVVQRSLQTPEVSRSPETEVCIRVLVSSRIYYIKDLKKKKKVNTIYYPPIPVAVRRHVNPAISYVLPLTLARDVTSLAPQKSKIK
jgi:hypothetical protein